MNPLLNELLALPVKVDSQLRVITGPHKAYRWKLELPSSFTGTIRQRLYFSTEAEAKSKRLELIEGKGALGVDQQTKLSRRGMSVEDAVNFALRHAPVVSNLTVGNLLDQFVSHRINEVKVGQRYAATLQSYCVKIRDALGADQVHDLTRTKIRKFLDSLTSRDGTASASVRTRNHYLETLRALFAFGRQEGLLSASPTDGISTAKTDPAHVAVLSLDEVQKLLNVVTAPEHSDVAPAVLLQLFAGPRRSEIPHITWQIILDKYLRLDKVKRGTRNRPVELPQVLLDLLAPYRRSSGYVFNPAGVQGSGKNHTSNSAARHSDTRDIEDAYAWRLSIVARQAGVELRKNVLRHTAITMRVNSTGDIAATSRWAGNSPAVVFSNYLGAATPDDAKRFYALRPKPTGVVVKMPAASEQKEKGPDEQAAAV